MRLLPYLGQWAKYQICYNIRSFPRNKSLSVSIRRVFFLNIWTRKKESRIFERGNTFKESRNFISHWIWTDYRIHNSNSEYRLIQWKYACGGRMLEITRFVSTHFSIQIISVLIYWLLNDVSYINYVRLPLSSLRLCILFMAFFPQCHNR